MMSHKRLHSPIADKPRCVCDFPAPLPSGLLDVRMELVDLEAPRWAAPERKGGPMMPSTSAFGAEGEKLFKIT